MATPQSVTLWLRQLEAGDRAAAQPLWECYYSRLVRLARSRLRSAPRRVADEEDVALSAFDSFCRAVAQRRFPQLGDRNDLWRLLVTITARKAADLVEHEGRQKRGGGRGQSLEGTRTLEQAVGREPTPAFAAQVAEECRRLLGQLADAELRELALWKLEGYTNAEISQKLGCSEPTVERRLRLIRKCWEKEVAS